jgi:2-C-methyl-D-erythritol 4-phosphate cytidylyltransferase
MNVAIIAAGGSGKRLGAERAKQFLDLAGEPVLIHTLRRFETCPQVHQVIVALPGQEINQFAKLASTYQLAKLSHFVSGGRERQESVYNALQTAPREQTDIVIVHDGVRPLVTVEDIARVIAKAETSGAAILAVAAGDTVKEVQADRVIKTLDRRRLYLVQTPQAFRWEILIEAHERAMADGLEASDDAALLEHYGWPVFVVEGSARNIKITWPEDLIVGEAILKAMEGK